jgi:putative transposase
MWSMDFMRDTLSDGRSFRTLNVNLLRVCIGSEDYNRKVLGIEVDFSLPTRRVIRCLERLIEILIKPITINHYNPILL